MISAIAITLGAAVSIIMYRVVVEQLVSDTWDEWFYDSGPFQAFGGFHTKFKILVIMTREQW